MTIAGSDGDAQVTLRPMTADEFESWRERSVQTYAEHITRASGRPLEATLVRAREQFSELLPMGLASENSWLLRILDADMNDVGVLWLGPSQGRTDAAYVYEIEIDETYRRRGLARAALTAAEGLVRGAGLTELGLNVFGFNDAARRLYDSLGYRVVATQMSKTLT